MSFCSSNAELDSRQKNKLKEFFKEKYEDSYIREEDYNREMYRIFVNGDRPSDEFERNSWNFYYVGVYCQFLEKDNCNYDYYHYHCYVGEYYNKSLDRGTPHPSHVLTNLGIYYQNNGDYNLALDNFTKAKEMGSARAMYRLGCFYRDVEKNYGLAAENFLMAMHNNNPYPQANVCYYDCMRKNLFENEAKAYEAGCHYRDIEKNYDLAKTKFIMAIDNGCIKAMHDLGYYYQYTEKNYDLVKKYYLMAIEKGNSESMYNLGCYYRDIEKNYDLMKKYYLQAVEKGHEKVTYEFGYYYQYTEKNYELMKKYYFMDIEKGNSDTMNILGYYYQYTEKNYELMNKYYLMAIKKGNKCAMDNFSKYLKDNIETNNFAHNYLLVIEKNNPRIYLSNIDNLIHRDNISENQILNLFCEIIDDDLLCIEDFEYCATQVFDYIYKDYDPNLELRFIDNFIEYIGYLYHGKSKKDNIIQRKNIICKIIKSKSLLTRLFDKILQLFYEKYTERKYAPGGEKYEKAKEEFYSVANKQNN